MKENTDLTQVKATPLWLYETWCFESAAKNSTTVYSTSPLEAVNFRV